MKIVLSCGQPHSEFARVHDLLNAAGVAHAKPSSHRVMAPGKLLERMYLAHDLAADGDNVSGQFTPGKMWEELAADLFVTNISGTAWGWADSRTTWTLEFWKSFESQTRFVLVYTSPAYAIGHMLGEDFPTPAQCTQLIASWINFNTELLRFYHRNEARCLLVNAEAALHSPAELITRIAAKFGIDVQPVAAPVDGNDNLSALKSCIARPLAETFTDAISLFAELESSADLAGAPAAGEMDLPLHAWQAFLDSQARTRAEQQSAEARLIEVQTEFQQTLAAQQQEVGQMRQTLQVNLETVVQAKEARQRLMDEITALGSENELLLIQINQMQDELEHYAHENLQLTTQIEQVAVDAKAAAAQVPAYQLSDMQIDLTREIHGDNWYYAEQDGRWAGPGDTSVIRIPAMRAGNYEVYIDVVDAKANDILSDMTVSINDVPLSLHFEGQGVVALVSACFSTSDFDEAPVWRLQFHFPRLISPASEGSDDVRLLAIRVRSLKLARVLT